MAVTTQGMATEFNSTVAKLKKWSDSQTDAQLLELGEYLYTFPPAGKKEASQFFLQSSSGENAGSSSSWIYCIQDELQA